MYDAEKDPKYVTEVWKALLECVPILPSPSLPLPFPFPCSLPLLLPVPVPLPIHSPVPPIKTLRTNTPRHSMLTTKRVTPVVYTQTYTLDTVVQGLDDLEQRKTWGKAIVRVRDPNQAKL